MASDNSAPGELELVRRFVNTLDTESGDDELASPAGLQEWLASSRLADSELPVREADRKRAVEFREALRALLLHNNGGAPPPPGAIRALNEAGAGSGLAVRFAGDGSARLEPNGSGVDAALSRLAAIVLAAGEEGTFKRLKICPADDCLWAFYDHSRNRSATWCKMEVCGNRAKVRSYRERQARRGS